MLDISKLERRWLTYKIKKTLPYVLLLTALCIIAFTIPWILSNKSSSTTLASFKKSTVKEKISNTSTAKHDEGTMVLEPSLHFIESIQSTSIPVVNTVVPPLHVIKPVEMQKILPSTAPLAVQPPVITQPQTLKTTQPPLPPPIVKPSQTLVKGKLTSIKRDDATFDIHEIEERFKENSNPNLGVYIAKYHYDHSNYSEAYNYALKTNSINSSIDDSWLIFAKSLVKLGKEEQAKKTLQLYISNSNSQNAKNYLDTLNRETVK
jgi:hypothetical protein